VVRLSEGYNADMLNELYSERSRLIEDMFIVGLSPWGEEYLAILTEKIRRWHEIQRRINLLRIWVYYEQTNQMSIMQCEYGDTEQSR
jgi:hypothetical protein